MSQEVLLALISAASAIFGGLLVKALDKLLPSGDRKMDDAAVIRKELWERQEDLETRLELRQKEHEESIRDMQSTVDEWKTKYFELMEEHHKLKAENHAIRAENHQLLSKISALKMEMQLLENKFRKLSGALADDVTPGPTADMPGSGASILNDEVST